MLMIVNPSPQWHLTNPILYVFMRITFIVNYATYAFYIKKLHDIHLLWSSKPLFWCFVTSYEPIIFIIRQSTLVLQHKILTFAFYCCDPMKYKQINRGVSNFLQWFWKLVFKFLKWISKQVRPNFINNVITNKIPVNK